MKKKIKIPHLGYTVIVMDRKSLKREWSEWMANATERIDKNTSIIYLESRKKGNISSVAHELVHVLQNIIWDRGMFIENEKEHTAYLMQYLFNEIMGYEYDV